jgi:hypothetical protein
MVSALSRERRSLSNIAKGRAMARAVVMHRCGFGGSTWGD